MNVIERLLYSLDEMLDTRRKRHIAGGVLLSMSALFGGLAATVLTVKGDDVNE